MEFVKNKVQEIWSDQAFVSSQVDGVESRLVALERVAASFSHFIIEHWVPTQAILIDLHNSTCPSCQRADGMADNGGSVRKLDLSHLCFSLNFLFSYVSSQFPSMFPLLTYPQ